MIRFGPAGWTYKDWAGIVYPPKKPKGFDELAYIARYFDTVEINSTFYRPVSKKVAKGWAERVADNPRFRFTAKLSRRFTHEREAWTREEVREARAGFDALMTRQRLGAVLLQFPWSFRRDDDNREWLGDLVSALEGLPLVVEVRHESWNTPEFFVGLLERGVGFVNIDQPLYKHSIKPSAVVTSPVGYIRVHGRNYKDWWRTRAAPHERYDYLYSAKELKPWAERARQLAADPRSEEIYVVTNNHFRGKAPTNALMLQSMVEEKKVEAPPELVATYPEELNPYVRRQSPEFEAHPEP